MAAKKDLRDRGYSAGGTEKKKREAPAAKKDLRDRRYSAGGTEKKRREASPTPHHNFRIRIRDISVSPISNVISVSLIKCYFGIFLNVLEEFERKT